MKNVSADILSAKKKLMKKKLSSVEYLTEVGGNKEINMITAAQAKAATIDRLVVIAKEFIINNMGIPLQDAINDGKFHCTVSFDGVPSPEATGAEVVRQLKEQGYVAEHVYYDGPNGYANYIKISWED